MTSIDERLEPGEEIVYQARVHGFSYIVAVAYLLTIMTPGKLSGLATTRVVLTNKRVIGKSGALMQERVDLAYKDIDLVKSRQGILGKIFDYGTLVIVDKNGKRTKFHGISEPLDVQLQIEEAIEMAVLGRKLSQVKMDKF